MQVKEQSVHIREKRARRIEAILDVAMSILGSEGVEGVTIHRLAKELDLTVGALYRYFDSKEALITSLWRRTLTGYEEELISVREYCLSQCHSPLSDADSIAVLVAMAQEYVWQSRAHLSRFYFMMQALTRETVLLPENVRPELMKGLFALLAVIEASVAEAEEARALRGGNERQRTMSFWATLNGAMSLNKIGKTDPQDAPTNHLVEEMLLSLFRGWGASDSILVKGWECGLLWHAKSKEKKI